MKTNVVADLRYLDLTVRGSHADLLSAVGFSKNGSCHAVDQLQSGCHNTLPLYRGKDNPIMTLALPLNKSNPDARLARKREAARMRQQRCRARKRQALIVKRRHPEEQHSHGPPPYRDSRTEDDTDRAKPLPFREGPPSSSPNREPIFKIVSFDSPRSPCTQAPVFVSPDRSCSLVINRTGSVESSLSSGSTPEKRTVVVKIEQQSEGEGSLVKEEAAAIAAMLSLKASDSQKATPSTTPPPASPPQETRKESCPTPARAPTKDRKYAHYGEWEQYHYPYNYGRYGHSYPPPPPYYPVPPRGWVSNYRYPAYNKNFSRERYE